MKVSKIEIKQIGLLTLACLIQGLVVHFLIVPAQLTAGGIGSIAGLISYLTDGRVPTSLMLFALNVPLIIASAIFVKPSFALKCVYGVAVASLIIFLLEVTKIPGFTAIAEQGVDIALRPTEMDKFLGGIFTGIFFGVAISIAMRAQGCLGGTEIISLILQNKFPRFSVAWLAFFFDAIIIVAASAFYGSFMSIMYGAVSAFICYKTVDVIQQSWLAAVAFNIITTKPKEMGEMVYNEVKRGITKVPAVGAYSGAEKTVCITILRRGQALQLQRKLKDVDPDAFSYITKVERTFGNGFLGVVHASSTLGVKKKH